LRPRQFDRGCSPDVGPTLIPKGSHREAPKAISGWRSLRNLRACPSRPTKKDRCSSHPGPEGGREGDRVTDALIPLARHVNLGSCGAHHASLEARGVNAVVVGQKDLHAYSQWIYPKITFPKPAPGQKETKPFSLRPKQIL